MAFLNSKNVYKCAKLYWDELYRKYFYYCQFTVFGDIYWVYVDDRKSCSIKEKQTERQRNNIHCMKPDWLF